MNFTQCMIVKNEEHNLRRALSWGKNFFQEQIVVDTGSTDNTVALAQELGANVYHFKWINDFSAARNYAISQCSGDWIFFLDADEYVEESDVPKLNKLIEKVDGLFKRINGKKLYYNVIELPWLNGDGQEPGLQARIFRNVPYLRYEGELHEQICAKEGGYRKVYTVKESPVIYHTGYEWSEKNDKNAKNQRNFTVAQKALENNPESAKFQLFAAESLMEQNRYKEAESYFIKAMENRDGSIWKERLCEGYKQWLTNYLRVADTPECPVDLLIKVHNVYQMAGDLFPEDPDFDILASLIYLKGKDIINMVTCFQSSLTKNGGRITGSLIDSGTYAKLQMICGQLGELFVGEGEKRD